MPPKPVRNSTEAKPSARTESGIDWTCSERRHCSRLHPQALVRFIDPNPDPGADFSRNAEGWVDRDLAPLVFELLRAGILISDCCQESKPGWAEIEFPSSGWAEGFMERVGTIEMIRGWEFGIALGQETPDTFSLSVTVRFPRSDIPAVYQRMVTANEEEALEAMAKAADRAEV